MNRPPKQPHPAPANDPKIPIADTIKVRVCEHGNVTLLMLDANGKPIAGAVMSLDCWIGIGDDVFEQTSAIVDAHKKPRAANLH